MTLLHGNADLFGREWAIIALVSRGCTNAQIAFEIQTSSQDVENYLRRILQKTGCWNRTEVALWYSKLGVETERRFYDRRTGAYATLRHEGRKSDRRQSIERALRAKEEHNVNLDE
jgi:DNA-binding CsgD family transcriptional regulator